jgi:hypothetical protein
VFQLLLCLFVIGYIFAIIFIYESNGNLMESNGNSSLLLKTTFLIKSCSNHEKLNFPKHMLAVLE